MLGFAIIETLFAGVIFSVCHCIHHVAAWTDCPKTAEGEKDVNFLEQIWLTNTLKGTSRAHSSLLLSSIEAPSSLKRHSFQGPWGDLAGWSVAPSPECPASGERPFQGFPFIPLVLGGQSCLFLYVPSAEGRDGNNNVKKKRYSNPCFPLRKGPD